MTVLSRGARVRRGGRRPGWLLTTALLVLAIGASSALVFTDRVELLKLAVILALWAAVVAAFVSVIYRRQSDVDQARVRDLKLVYDLQLDREISARREYELTVESQLRRELATELRAQAADEVAALRTELAALRTNLEVLFETELDQRPALETERAAVRGYREWPGTGDSASADWVASNRVTSVRAEATSGHAEEHSIIDVPEEPVPRQPVFDAPEPFRGADAYRQAEESQRNEVYPAPVEGYAARDAYRGSHRRPAEDDRVPGQEGAESRQQRHSRHQPEAPPPPPEPRPEYRDARPQQQAPQQTEAQLEPQRSAWYPPPAAESTQPTGPAAEWQPATSDGLWSAAEAPGGQWASAHDDEADDTDPRLNGVLPVRRPAPEPLEPPEPFEPPAPNPHRGRHSSPAEPGPEPGGTESVAEQRPPARHSTERAGLDAGTETGYAAFVNGSDDSSLPRRGVVEPPARHRSAESSDDQDPPSGGQSAADLLARFQVEPAGGGRRRRREE